MAGGGWRVASGGWRVVGGRWQVVGGRWRVAGSAVPHGKVPQYTAQHVTALTREVFGELGQVHNARLL